MRTIRLLLLLGVVSTGGCEHSPALIAPGSTPAPAVLGADARAALSRVVDVDALSGLLGDMTPAAQSALLASLPASPEVPPSGGETRDVTILIHSSDPARQELLDRLWAPYWSRLRAAALKDSAQVSAGREPARRPAKPAGP